jgi:hypothetical protein
VYPFFGLWFFRLEPGYTRSPFYTPFLTPPIASGNDNDVEMDGGSVKNGDMDARNQPALPSEKINLCQYSGLTPLPVTL